MKKYLIAGMALLMTSTAYAAPVEFFGEDLGLGEGTPLAAFPNSAAAEASFLSNLSGVSIENFEGFATGTGAPLAVNFATVGVTATLDGNGSVATVASGSTNGVGRYATSGTNYWEATNEFSINFSEAISAFGFYGIDIGDFDGQVVLNLLNGGTTELNIGNSTNIAGGSVLYYGFYDLEESYTSITFSNTAGGVDFFGFDDFTVGTLENITPNAPVPEPATMLLFGTGIAGLAGLRSRRNKKK